MESTAVGNVVYTGKNKIFKVHTWYEIACTTVYSITFRPTCTSCTTEEYIVGGEYIDGGDYSSRQHFVHW